MKTYITGKVAIELCDWIYDDMRIKQFNRAKFNKLLQLSLKYNTNNVKNVSRWVYDSDNQRLKFYGGSYIEKEVWFKEQLAH